MQEPPIKRLERTPAGPMHKTKESRNKFEIEFFESILRRNPKDTDVIELLGGLYTKEGRIDDGLKMDRRLVRLLPSNSTAHYNLACSLALKKRKAEALRSLERAIALGYRDVDWLLQDPDLEILKSHPAFQALISRISR